MRDVHQGQGIATPYRDRLYARIGCFLSIDALATGEESLYAMTVWGIIASLKGVVIPLYDGGGG